MSEVVSDCPLFDMNVLQTSVRGMTFVLVINEGCDIILSMLMVVRVPDGLSGRMWRRNMGSLLNQIKWKWHPFTYSWSSHTSCRWSDRAHNGEWHPTLECVISHRHPIHLGRDGTELQNLLFMKVMMKHWGNDRLERHWIEIQCLVDRYDRDGHGNAPHSSTSRRRQSPHARSSTVQIWLIQDRFMESLLCDCNNYRTRAIHVICEQCISPAVDPLSPL